MERGIALVGLNHRSAPVEVRERLRVLLEVFDTVEGAPASREQVERCHTASYLDRLEALEVPTLLDPDTVASETSYEAALLAAGGALAAVDRGAFALVRPPGHHAPAGRAMGFCLVNNVAVGLYAARAKGIRRVAILDFDVHHGNGTQNTFADDAEVFYASTHQYPFYPGTGAAAERGMHDNILNVPLASGSGDRVFLGAWEGKIGPALTAFKPDLLLVSAGFDAHADDPLAGLETERLGTGTPPAARRLSPALAGLDVVAGRVLGRAAVDLLPDVVKVIALAQRRDNCH